MTRRKMLGWSLFVLGVAVLTSGAAAQGGAPAPQSVPEWLTAGVLLSLLGAVVTFGGHIEFKGDAKRRLQQLEERAEGAVQRDEFEKGTDRILGEMERRFKDLHSHVAMLGADRRQEPRP